MTRAGSRRAPRLAVAIVGGSGYGGSELLRLLLFHPRVEVTCVTSRAHAGKPVASVHRHLTGVTDLVFSDPEPKSILESAQALFLAVPHGEARALATALDHAPWIIDLSTDHRVPLAGLDGVHRWVYGLTEFHRDELRGATRIANPGCFATAILLATIPIVQAGLAGGVVVADATTGSSGSGEKPREGTHHPERAAAFRAYKPLAHQHLAEIRRELGRHGGGGVHLAFVPHSGPFVRGIFATVYAQPGRAVDLALVRAKYATVYSKERFIRIVDESPDVTVVAGSNFADLALATDGTTIVAMSAIDNLVKGMAGQAVQNLNVAMGWHEDEGLAFPGLRP